MVCDKLFSHGLSPSLGWFTVLLPSDDFFEADLVFAVNRGSREVNTPPLPVKKEAYHSSATGNRALADSIASRLGVTLVRTVIPSEAGSCASVLNHVLVVGVLHCLAGAVCPRLAAAIVGRRPVCKVACHVGIAASLPCDIVVICNFVLQKYMMCHYCCR